MITYLLITFFAVGIGILLAWLIDTKPQIKKEKSKFDEDQRNFKM